MIAACVQSTQMRERRDGEIERANSFMIMSRPYIRMIWKATKPIHSTTLSVPSWRAHTHTHTHCIQYTPTRTCMSCAVSRIRRFLSAWLFTRSVRNILWSIHAFRQLDSITAASLSLSLSVFHAFWSSDFIQIHVWLYDYSTMHSLISNTWQVE